MNIDRIDNQRTIRIDRHWLGPERIGGFATFSKRHHLTIGGAKFIDRDERFAPAHSIAGNAGFPL